MSLNVKDYNYLIAFLDLFAIAFLIFDLGFDFGEFRTHKIIALPTIVLLLIGFNLFRFWKFKNEPSIHKNTRTNLSILLILLLVSVLFIVKNYQHSLAEALYSTRIVPEIGLLIYFFIRLSFLMRFIYKKFFNPAILFIGSFALIALTGTFLLLLPNATTEGIGFTDALFSATSAVSVNGLMVMDTASDFTTFGQSVLMVLFQLGGLGMLTFTSFFAYFFKSGASYGESLFMQDILGGDQMSNILRKTMNIVIFSFVIEIIGALLIYYSADVPAADNPIYFAVFHAISAYCNAGFTLMSDSLQSIGFRFNYSLQWILMMLIVFGGLGFAIANNFIQYIRQFFINIFQSKKRRSTSRLITLNTKLTVYTSIILIFGGALFFVFSEYHGALTADQTIFGKLTTALFSSVTTRTAGFNTVNPIDFSIPGLLVIMFLMWVGAAPASTGGGIKTTTFALATLNMLSIARGKSSIEIGTRSVGHDTVRRAFAIIIISLLAIGISIVLLLILNPGFTLLQVAFEGFGAYSTTGLSLGITPELSQGSKFVIIFMMFFGRIGLMNLMIGILKRIHKHNYSYPKEDILIN